MGRVTAVAHADDEALWRVADRLSAHGYGVRATDHFVVCQKPPAQGAPILMHRFNEVTADADLSSMIADELPPLGVISTAADYGDALYAVVASTCPVSLNCLQCGHLHLALPAIWRHYSANTLRRMRPLIAGEQLPHDSQMSKVMLFATVYGAIIANCRGSSVLDVGSDLGLLPVLLAEHHPGMTIVGCDVRPYIVASATDLAEAMHVGQVRFLVRDVLDPDFDSVGRFDTVVAVHVLEHLTDQGVATALTTMLRVAAMRLIIAVPYEENVTAVYGHEQTFTPEKLRFWGNWCIEALGGGRFECEDVHGGLLVVDRPTAGEDSVSLAGKLAVN